jgi:hypothetical protein
MAGRDRTTRSKRAPRRTLAWMQNPDAEWTTQTLLAAISLRSMFPAYHFVSYSPTHPADVVYRAFLNRVLVGATRDLPVGPVRVTEGGRPAR